MIQKTTQRQLNAVLGQTQRGTALDGPEQWSQWVRDRHYSLEVNQHPIRARMCGFGDKDRRPLAPAAVAKMVVRREDNSIVDVDDVDVDFFVVTVDLWSADGKQEMNLIRHPSSTDRCLPVHVTKSRKRGSTVDKPPRPSPYPTPLERPLSLITEYIDIGIFNNRMQPTPLLASSPSYNNYQFPSSSNGWSAATTDPSWSFPSTTPALDRTSFQLPSIHSLNRPSPAQLSTTFEPPLSDLTTSFRSWNEGLFDSQPQPQTQPQVDSRWEQDPFSLPSLPTLDPWSPLPAPLAQPQLQQQQLQSAFQAFSQTPAAPPAPAPVPSQQPQAQIQREISPLPRDTPPLPRHTYTRALVGPLSANAQRLQDEHRKPGIFFLFQDLSIRTEGTFRLRMRLMNVGESPAPNGLSNSVHTGISPVLAEIFTEPFTVYSAKRFPGVPDTTALSIAFGNQGQKLPLRNRHGTGKQQRRRRPGTASSDEDSS
ncbi:velvet factor [Hysterangium stoloniferum]|nr:velvet factor [Hysterangium stoloniferum]